MQKHNSNKSEQILPSQEHVLLKRNNPPSFGNSLIGQQDVNMIQQNYKNHRDANLVNAKGTSAHCQVNNNQLPISHQSSFRSFGIVDMAKIQNDCGNNDVAGAMNTITHHHGVKNNQSSHHGRRRGLHTQQSLVLPSQQIDSAEQLDEQFYADDDDDCRSSSIDQDSNEFEFLSGSEIAATRAGTKVQKSVNIHLMKEDASQEQNNESSMLLKNQRIELEADGSFYLAPVLEQIEQQGCELAGCVISYYNDWHKRFIHVGRYQSPESMKFRVASCTINWDNGRLILKTTSPSAEICSKSEDTFTPTAKQATAAQSPCIVNSYSPANQRKPPLKHAMTADFNGNLMTQRAPVIPTKQQQQFEEEQEADDSFAPAAGDSSKLLIQMPSFYNRSVPQSGILTPVHQSPHAAGGCHNELLSFAEASASKLVELQILTPTKKERAVSDDVAMTGNQRVSALKDKKKNYDAVTKTVFEQKREFKRVKERTIKDVIRKVCVWRRLYNGILRPDGTLVRYTLENAARKNQMSKKSLDDYLHQIRLGTKYKFDFKNRQNEKFGTLRTYIKMMRQKEKGLSVNGEESNEMADVE